MPDEESENPLEEPAARASEEHPSADLLAAFAAGRLAPERARPVVRHLLGRCRVCSERIRAELAPADDEGSYDGAVERAIAAFRSAGPGKPPADAGTAARSARSARSDRPGPSGRADHWRRLTASAREAAAARLQARIGELPGLGSAAQCRTLLAAARELRQSDPEAATLLCLLGVAVAAVSAASDAATAAREEDRPPPGLQARIWAELGEGRRLAGDVGGAESAFAEAHRRFARGRGDAVLYGEILELHGRLRLDRGRFGEAAEMLGWAEGLFRGAGRCDLAGRAMIARGVALGGAGDRGERADPGDRGDRSARETGARAILRGLELADVLAARDAAIEGLHHLALFVIELGMPALGRAVAKRARRLDLGGEVPSLALRRRWLEGELAAALVEYLPASRALREAQAGFAALGRPYEALQVTLAMAALELDHARRHEAEILLDGALRAAGALRLAPEGRRAIEDLAEAARRRRASAAMTRVTAQRVRDAGVKERTPSR